MVPDLVKPDPEIEKMLYRKCDSLFAVLEFLEEKDKKGELYQPPHLKRRLKAGSGRIRHVPGKLFGQPEV